MVRKKWQKVKVSGKREKGLCRFQTKFPLGARIMGLLLLLFILQNTNAAHAWSKRNFALLASSVHIKLHSFHQMRTEKPMLCPRKQQTYSHFVTDTISFQYIQCTIQYMNHKMYIDLTVNFPQYSLNLKPNKSLQRENDMQLESWFLLCSHVAFFLTFLCSSLPASSQPF